MRKGVMRERDAIFSEGGGGTGGLGAGRAGILPSSLSISENTYTHLFKTFSQFLAFDGFC